MKHKFLIGIQIFLGIFIVATGVAFANQAGSSEDPLVAKSYVDDKINQVLNIINDNNSNTTSNINNTVSLDSTLKYTPVLVEVGQTIYGEEGTEFILRSGKGKAVVPGQEGIANITNGTDLSNNDTVSKNELLIIPRSDGRGVAVTEKAWFLVKGGYEIK